MDDNYFSIKVGMTELFVTKHRDGDIELDLHYKDGNEYIFLTKTEAMEVANTIIKFCKEAPDEQG